MPPKGAFFSSVHAWPAIVAPAAVVVAAAALGFLGFKQWFAVTPGVTLEERVPGMSGPETRRGMMADAVTDPEENQGDSLRCFSLEDGSEIWRRGYEIKIKRNHGVSRTVPAVTDDAGATKKQLVCYHPERGVVWRSGNTTRFGLGPLLVADDKLFILRDDGVLVLAEAGTAAYVELARARVLQGRDAWAPMALVGGRLLLRNSKELICLDVSAL
jgi:hypothetical protein